MTGARAALAALALSGIRTVAAAPCAPRAALDGDAAAVARVSVELQRLGVAIGPAPLPSACPVVVAAVELDRNGGIDVAVRDASHRSEGRVVSDAALAAAWIDSWLRDDFEAPSVEPPPRYVAPKPLAPERSFLDGGSLAASFDQTWTDDRSRWSGVAVAGCVRVGALCVGARLRYATQDITSNATAATRTDSSVLATASLPRDLGRMSVAPELGLGLGRLTTTRLDGCLPMKPPCDPTTTTCPPQPPPNCSTNPAINGAAYVGDGLHEATITPRMSAALRIAVPLADHVWLDGLAAITYAPLGHGDPFPTAAGAGPSLPPDQLALPGEPRAALQLGVGLRVGAR